MNAEDTRKIRLVMHLRSMGISSTEVLAAMEKVPRDTFVPPQMMDQAYEDIALPIGRGQTISQPLVVAMMTQALELNDRDKVLEIGTGSGYQAAVLAELGYVEVYSIEIVPDLAESARSALAQAGYRNVEVRSGNGYLGWPEAAPFDKIIVTCSPESVPRPLVEQLVDGGRMVVPVGERPEALVEAVFRGIG